MMSLTRKNTTPLPPHTRMSNNLQAHAHKLAPAPICTIFLGSIIISNCSQQDCSLQMRAELPHITRCCSTHRWRGRWPGWRCWSRWAPAPCPASPGSCSSPSPPSSSWGSWASWRGGRHYWSAAGPPGGRGVRDQTPSWVMWRPDQCSMAAEMFSSLRGEKILRDQSVVTLKSLTPSLISDGRHVPDLSLFHLVYFAQSKGRAKIVRKTKSLIWK